MEKENVKENVNGKFEHFLKAVEFLGNKLPDITILFLIAFFIIHVYLIMRSSTAAYWPAPKLGNTIISAVQNILRWHL